MAAVLTKSKSNVSSSEIHSGMGAIIHDTGVAFRVWAPNADNVSVIGSFNNWEPNKNEMRAEEHGYWYCDIKTAKPNDEYKFHIVRNGSSYDRIDPYAREVTNSVGNAIVYQDSFDWEGDGYSRPPQNELVIYEMHIGTFHRPDPDTPGTFADAIKKFGHLKKLGINAIQVMPIAEFAGDLSWGYNPAHIFAVEQVYGGPDALKHFIREAHKAGFAVIIDVVYNHFGPSDLDLWQFDGWQENDKGGIYFYQDHRSSTPWGDTRPDYGRGEVRQFIYDNAKMWMNEYHADGLRYDMTAYIRTVSGIGNDEIADGWGLMQWINRDLKQEFPGCYLIAEDLQKNNWLTKSEDHGGAGFTSQWDAGFVHPVRDVLIQVEDGHRDMWAVRDALCNRYNDDAFQRVIYSESHDEVANGKARVPSEVDTDDPESRHAQKRSVLGIALTLTAPGIPMLFQGQELLETEWFRDTEPLDWDRAKSFRGIGRLVHDLINLRLNSDSQSPGLTGQFIDMHHVNEKDKVVAFVRRSDVETSHVMIMVNFSNRPFESYRVGIPKSGRWHLKLNTDWIGYSDSFDDHPVSHIDAAPEPRDGFAHSADIAIGAYAALIYVHEAESDSAGEE